MAKAVHNDVIDAALAEIATSTTLTLTSAQPANFAGIAAVTLGSYTITPGLGGGDFSAATDGDTSGRKVTVQAQSGNNASATGAATHICLDDGATLLYVTTCPTVNTNNGQAFTVAAWDIEIADPS